MPAFDAFDQRMMAVALSLAQRGLGDTWPNPTVGCLIVKDQVIVGRGVTGSGGRPHAETEALKAAGDNARGATAYVTLEPCSHHGKTPPCAEALVAAGITRVVAATGDPDPRVSGRGFAKLRDAGIVVVEGVSRAEADRLNAGFFLRVTERRPLFALKVAGSLDGRIALADGSSQWITGPQSRAAAHAIRARFDAILAGSETILKDNPRLNSRMPGYSGRTKIRIALDRRQRLLPDRDLMNPADGPVWVYHRKGPSAVVQGVEFTGLDHDDDTFLTSAASEMADSGLTRVLIEGGGTVAASFLKADLVDEIYWFSAGMMLGGDGIPAIGRLGLDRLSAAEHFMARDTVVFGDDRLTILTKKP